MLQEDSETLDRLRQPPEIDRRSLLKLMGASLALASLAGCKGEEDEDALPYVRQPENVTLGVAKWYATAVTFCGYGQPVLGKTFTGRPVKLEGNPEHPAAEGKSSSFTQAALLGLYDPGRSRGPRHLGRTVSWDPALAALEENALAMRARRGEGMRLLTGPVSSPTLLRQIRAILARWPGARWHVLDTGMPDGDREATKRLFGKPMALHPSFEEAETIVCFDDDFLGPGPRQTLNGVQFGKRRRLRQTGEGGSYLTVAETAPTPTGAVADRRVIVRPEEIGMLLHALAARLGIEDVKAPALAGEHGSWVEETARALFSARGKSLVTVGAYHSPALCALGLLINERLGNFGQTLRFGAPVLGSPDADAGLAALAAEMRAGTVKTLLCLEANPAYAAPADLGFAEAMNAVPLRIHAGLYYDETASLSHWHLPLQHDLEQWSDVRAVDGSASIIQPLVKPFFDVRSRHEVLDALTGGNASSRSIVQETWRAQWPGDFDAGWREALYKGVVAGSAPETGSPAVIDRALDEEPSQAHGGLTALIRPDPSIWDGTFSENAWMQETPKPLSKVVWENVIQIGRPLADRHGLNDGDLVELTDGTASVRGPVWVAARQAADTVVLTLGYGRRLDSGISAGAGYDAGRLRRMSGLWMRPGVKLVSLGEHVRLATTQPHQNMDGYDFARIVDPAEPETVENRTREQPSFYPDQPRNDPSWGMTIDLDLCIGCNACVTACQAENNIPVVGKDLVAEGREMQWIRVDHYVSERMEGPDSFFQPVPCMHCEQAPCEMGCPVNAAVHSIDGLNLQVYNRCIGTRTCSSFCPYKVRRFNWFDYTTDDPESVKAMRNPDVTVRSRGIMEKCTYCVQRIAEARINADKDGRAIRDGEVVTACQQACPTRAIVFGNVSDETSEVSRRKAEGRNYSLLEEANTRPRTTYLARLAGKPSDPRRTEG